MLLNLLRAEWQKMVSNKMLASFTLWAYPVGATAFIIVAGFLIHFMKGGTPFASEEWTKPFLGPWGILLTFPGNVMTRLPMIAFIAVVFAGEYEWGTWKNIVPRAPRAPLILTKFLATALIVCLTLAATCILWGTGRAIVFAIYGHEVIPAVTGQVIIDLAGQFALEVLLAFAMSLVLASFTALAVLLTRSFVGGLILGFGLSIVEALSGLLFGLFSGLFDKPALINGYAYTPGYAIDNIRSWALHSQALLPAPSFSLEPSLGVSIAVLAAWIVGLAGITVLLFERQDLTA